jgi:hypothetical protein
MTKSVSFSKCAKAIAKFAFVASAYPLIITLENHCDEINKRRVASVGWIFTRAKLFEYFLMLVVVVNRFCMKSSVDICSGIEKATSGTLFHRPDFYETRLLFETRNRSTKPTTVKKSKSKICILLKVLND